MKSQVTTKWLEKMSFEVDIAGQKFVIDAEESVGGQNKGPRPKPLMLAALAGCTAMDVISILKKMRVDLVDFNVNVDGDLTEEMPKYYNRMHIIYEFTGKDLPMDKLEKAVNLSQERYCGVSAFYKKVIEVTFEIVVHQTINN